MKKIFFISVMAAMSCLPCFSEEVGGINNPQQQNTVEALFNKFSKEKKTTHIKIGSIIMKFANAFTDTKGVTDVEVFAFEECDSQVKDKLNAAIKSLKDSAYETLVSANQNGENTKVLVKLKDNYINEIVVVTSGNDPAFVRIKGKIKPEDIDNVIKNNK